MYFKMVEPTESHKSFASLPYIKVVTEPLTRSLKKYDVTFEKKRLPLYKNSSQLLNSDLRWTRRPMSCIKFHVQIVRGFGETSRVFNTRKKEHLRNIKTLSKGSRTADHAWLTNHIIDFENVSVVDKDTSRTRKTLEGWQLNQSDT